MADVTSELRVHVSTPGLEQARKALDNLNKTATGGAQDQAHSFTQATASLSRMVTAVDQLAAKLDAVANSFIHVARAAAVAGQTAGQALGGATGAAGAAIPKGNALDIVARYAGMTPAATPAVARGNALDVLRSRPDMTSFTAAATRPMSFGDRMRAGAGAFGLGALQGMLPGQLGFVQRGAGAIPQMLGMSVANSLSHAASIPFTGASGLLNAVGSVPLVGGLAAAPLAHYMNQADRVTSFQRQQAEMAPLLGMQALRADGGYGSNLQALDQVGPPTPGLSGAARVARDRARIAEMGNDALGLMGVGIGEGQAFRAGLARASGTSADRLGGDFVRTAMAAQTNLGLSPETTGAFGLAARTGAVAGGGSANDLLMRAINQSRQLGLSEPEQQNYLRTIAEGISQFQQTGIPLQMDSIRDLTAGFQGTGLTNQAAGRAALTTQARAQSFAQGGPQTALDMQIMQREGFKGGLQNFLRTRRKLARDPDAVAKDTMAIAAQQATSLDRDLAIDQVGDTLRTIGITNPEDVERFVDERRAGKGGDFGEAMRRAQAPTGGLTAQAFQGAAAAGVPAAARTMAQTANVALANSGDAAQIAAQLDATAGDVASSGGRFFSLLTNLTSALRQTVGGMTGTAGDIGAGPPAMRAGN